MVTLSMRGTTAKAKYVRVDVILLSAFAAFIFLFGFMLGRLQGGFDSLPPVKPDNIIGTSQQQQQLERRHAMESADWHSVDVFTGDRKERLRAELRSKGIMENETKFSQCGQEMYVLNLLRNKLQGYFIDLAANDAIHISNTLSLETTAGWSGLCIEPNPAYWFSLAYYRKCQVVVAVVASGRSEVQFTYKGVWGGVNGYSDEKHSHNTKTVPTLSLLEIFQRYQVPNVIDYFNLDVEGSELGIMHDFPFHLYTFSILSVERPGHALEEILKKQGYTFLKSLSAWGETLWAHESVLPHLDMSALNRTYEEFYKAEFEPDFSFGE